MAEEDVVVDPIEDHQVDSGLARRVALGAAAVVMLVLFATGANRLLGSDFEQRDADQRDQSATGATPGAAAELSFVRPTSPPALIPGVPSFAQTPIVRPTPPPAASVVPGDFELGEPLIFGDGTAVFDVGLSTGERLRVSVPESMADLLDAGHEWSDRRGVSLVSLDGALIVNFGFCELSERIERRMEINQLGSEVAIDGRTAIHLCRPDELLSSTFLLGSEATAELASAGLDAFDVRLVAPGSAHSAAMAATWPGWGECLAGASWNVCSPWGPHTFSDGLSEGVIVNRTGETSVTAVSADDLRPIWTVDPGGFQTTLVAGPGLYLAVTGGAFSKVDPESGAQLWQIDQDPDERGTTLSGYADDGWLLMSSFAVAGDPRAPLLRSIDIESGQIRWESSGRQDSSWQYTGPVALGGNVIAMDVSTWVGRSELPSATLRAYDQVSGELAWSTELDSTTEAYDNDLLAVFDFETGKALFVRTIEGELLRVDPSTGEILWRTTLGKFRFTGTDYGPNNELVLTVNNLGRETKIDPTTGERV